MRTTVVSPVVLGAACLAMGCAAFAQDDATELLLERAGEALGGLQRIENIENITLYGYGQYAYMFGGGNITSSPYAPMKWIAANALQRVYDLENNRFLQQEHRNSLFPFGSVAMGHSFQLTRLALDGDIAFNLAEDGAAQRVGDTDGGGIRWIDGPHMRRMWMVNNPVAAVRTALDERSSVSRPRVEDGYPVVDVINATGDRFAIGFDPYGDLPAWVRWSNPHDNLGEVTFTTHFSGYVAYDGVKLPLGYTTMIDWRDVAYFSMMVDGYTIDGDIVDLTAPPEVRETPEPIPQAPDVQAELVADGVWRLTGATMVVEFEDHLTLYELGGGRTGAQARLDAAAALVPGKRPTQLILSHNHFDHISGIRIAVANGLTIIARRGMDDMLRELAERPAPNYPDAQALNPQPLKFIPVDDHLRLEDGRMTMDIYHVLGHNHMADALFAFVPESGVLIEGDLATAAEELPWWADSYMDNIDHYGLDVKILAPVHSQVMTHEETLRYLAPGRFRVQQRCAEHEARGEYLPGCPAFLPRGD